MGAGESIESNLWNSTFQTQSKNSKVGIIKLTDKQTDEAFICRKISTLDKKEIQQMERLIDIKLSIQSPYVTKLERAEAEKHQDYCAYGKNFYVLFKKPYQTLKQQTLNRKFKSSLYSEAELQVMLQTGVKALSFLNNIGHAHENISSSSFFINENRSMILGDPWMFPRQSTLKMMRNGFIYPSPQVIKYQNNQIDLYNPHLSDLFTFGLVLLQVFHMVNMDCIYERCFSQVNYESIWVKLHPIKNQELKKRLFTLLDPEPRNREMIFKHYLKSINSYDMYNQKSKQNFKRNIDRYNLATSEVTEWKNEINFEARLNSSEGKKTFSVSTAENLQNEDRGYSYYERQYGQNPGYRTQQKVAQTGNINESPQSMNDKQLIKEPTYQSDDYSKFGSSSLQSHHQPHQNTQAFRTGSSRVKFTTSNASNWISNSPQIYSSQNITPNYQSSITNFPSYNLPQTLNYSPNYHFSQNPTLKPISNFNFAQKTFTNTLSSYTHQYSPQIKLPSPPTYTFASSYEPQRYEAPLTGSSASIKSKIESANSLIIEQTQKPVINFQKKSSQIQSTEASKISIVLQKQPQPIENRLQELIQQVIAEKTQTQEAKFSPKELQSKSESLTPSSKKHKINPSDYNKHYHLSTINQRSEMTDSLVSQNDQRSEILIQEDEHNQEDHKQKISQSQHQENQDSQVVLEENKIWSIVYPSGTKYIGQTKNDKRNGLGTFFYIDGSKYHGHWLDNKMNGQGTLFYPNGKIAYEGEWKMDNFHGKGKVFNDQITSFSEAYHYEDCSDIENHWLYYDGQLFEDRKEGKGVLKLVNNEWFQGTFTNDELHGLCKFYTLDGKCIEGIWQNSKLIKIVQTQQKSPSNEIQQKQ